MEHDFGYVYVLTNPAMPGRVKIGMSRRQPERRAAELSSATGVPEQFEVFHARSVENCAVAESVVHSVLEEQGLRTAKNREFFSLTPQSAKELVDKVADSLAEEGNAGVFAQMFVEQAGTISGSGRAVVADLEQALTLLEHATDLGHPVAPFLAGDVAIALADKRRGSEQARTALVERAQELFEKAAAAGVSRGYARAAEVALRLGDIGAYARLWGTYLASLPDGCPPPDEEVEFILVFLNEHCFEGEGTCPPVHPYLKSNFRSLNRAARAHGAPPEILAWFGDYACPLGLRMASKATWPAAGLAVLILFWLIHPEAFVMFIAGTLLLAGSQQACASGTSAAKRRSQPSDGAGGSFRLTWQWLRRRARAFSRRRLLRPSSRLGRKKVLPADTTRPNESRS